MGGRVLPDGVLALQADPGETGGSVVPGLRETEHEGQQALGLEGEGLVPQVIVAHHGIDFINYNCC